MPRRIPVGPFPHYYAIVDDEDYDFLSQFSWQSVENRSRRKSKTVYAVSETMKAGVRNRIPIHKMITGFSRTDHVNGIGLDNRRES